jgi:acyl-CoA dehydrogenase
VINREFSLAGFDSFGAPLHSGIVAPYILHYGTEEQKKRWLPRLATGEMVGAIAMTEPGTGSDLQAVKTSAKKSGNGYVLNGSKTFITNGQHANLIIVVAKTDTSSATRRRRTGSPIGSCRPCPRRRCPGTSTCCAG